MDMKVKCPNCAAVLAVHGKLLGRTVSCPACASRFIPTSSRQAQLRPGRPAPAAGKSLLTIVAANRPDRRPAPPPSDTHGSRVASLSLARTRTRGRSNAIYGGHAEAWDITPMVDVTFLLLIFFMITASFSIQKVIRTSRQSGDTPSTSSVSKSLNLQQECPIVQVDELNGYALITPDGRREEVLSKQDLILALVEVKENAGSEDSGMLSIHVHEESTHGALVAALDAGRAANFTRFTTLMVEGF